MSKLNPYELGLLGEAAIKRFISYPQRCRLAGMARDLSQDEKRNLAYLEASVEALNRMSLTGGGADLFPNLITYTLQHEIIDEEMESMVPRPKINSL